MDCRKFEKTTTKLTDREQKLLAEMAQLNLLEDSKLTVNISNIVKFRVERT